jgi:hypothetical protein
MPAIFDPILRSCRTPPNDQNDGIFNNLLERYKTRELRPEGISPVLLEPRYSVNGTMDDAEQSEGTINTPVNGKHQTNSRFCLLFCPHQRFLDV